MKSFLLLITLLAPPIWAAEQINIKVKGMVCSFCAQGIKKKFEKESSVQKVEVNLDEKWVKLSLQDKATLKDEKIKELISEAGYNVENIERSQK